MNNWFNKFLTPTPKFNFLIIGAQKSGTTSLHHALSLHPEIFVTNPIKEPGFFLPFEIMKDYYAKKNLHLKSEKHFIKKLLTGYKNEPRIGEASTFYSTLEWSNEALAQKIKDYNPEMKLIYLYRLPSKRIISHFYHELKKDSSLDFDDFLNQPEVFGISCYYERIAPYYKCLEKQIVFVNFKSMINNHQETLSKLYSFLEVDDKFKLNEFPKLNSKSSNHDEYVYESKILNHPNFNAIQTDQLKFKNLLIKSNHIH